MHTQPHQHLYLRHCFCYSLVLFLANTDRCTHDTHTCMSHRLDKTGFQLDLDICRADHPTLRRFPGVAARNGWEGGEAAWDMRAEKDRMGGWKSMVAQGEEEDKIREGRGRGGGEETRKVRWKILQYFIHRMFSFVFPCPCTCCPPAHTVCPSCLVLLPVHSLALPYLNAS